MGVAVFGWGTAAATETVKNAGPTIEKVETVKVKTVEQHFESVVAALKIIDPAWAKSLPKLGVARKRTLTDWFPIDVAGAMDPNDRSEQLLAGPSSPTLEIGCDPENPDTEPICNVRFDLSNVPPSNTAAVTQILNDIENGFGTHYIQDLLDLGVTIDEEAFQEENPQ